MNERWTNGGIRRYGDFRITVAGPVVLVVDDEDPMRAVLRLALQSSGYVPREAATGAAAIAEIHAHPPDAMILDLGLPDMDGADVIAAVRGDHSFPIIVLSARGEEQQQIRALDLGADDYVTKPFREGELMARVRAVLRSSAQRGELTEIVVGDLKLDVATRRVFVGSAEVNVTPTEFRLLHILARHAGRVVTHRQLLTEVWGPARVDDVQYLRVYMKQLRQKIERNPSQPERILTNLGVGYWLV